MDFIKLIYIIPFFFLSTVNSFSNDLPNIASDQEFLIDKKLELSISLSALADLEKLNLKNNQFIFHAGTKIVDNTIVSNGGRVLNIVTRSDDFKSARESSLELLKKINWDNGFYRKDIGYKVIKE